MLARAPYFRPVIDHMVEKDVEIKMYLLDDDEWYKVSVIHEFLKVFYKVTNEFSTSSAPTSNIYFKGVWDVECMLLETANGQHSFLANMVKEMKRKFNKYWLDYNFLLSCACVLDPHFKLKDSDGGGVGQCGEIGDESICDVIIASGSDRMANFSSWVNSKEKSVGEKSQLDLYLEEKNIDHNVKLDVLLRWKNNGAHRHPQLGALARGILAIPISSIPSDSTFSMGKKFINPWRASLASMTIQSLACYEDWLRAKGFSLSRSTLFNAKEDEDEDEEDDEDCKIIS
ncbi:Zinc finger BED domain-containing protein DAYSLEEPER [Bienertia sinuspersici]